MQIQFACILNADLGLNQKENVETYILPSLFTTPIYFSGRRSPDVQAKEELWKHIK